MADTKKTATLQALAVGAKLLLICAIVAALISAVNGLTAEPYAANLAAEKRKAIIAIFGSETVTYEPLSAEDAEITVYEVREGENVIGYCVESSAIGYGGTLTMTVGYHADRSIMGVSITSLSETPGLGARVQDAAYLSGYAGKSGEVTLGEDVDGISGATISSRAVLTGVNTATAELERLLTGGAQ